MKCKVKFVMVNFENGLVQIYKKNILKEKFLEQIENMEE